MKDKISKKIDEFKIVLDTLPTNTIKNRSKKKELIQQELQHSTNLLKGLTDEMDFRKGHILSFKENPDLNVIKENITKCDSINKFSEYNTPYEKIKLDYYLYQLHRYYKENISNVNECISQIISSFKQVNIVLTINDFNYNYYVQKYITEIFKNSSKEKLNKVFEECYWKCPEMLTILELNFKSIYLRNEKKINNLYTNSKNDFVKKNSLDEITDLYINLNDKLESKSLMDEYTLLKKFINNEHNIYDFNEANITKIKNHYFNENYTLTKAKNLRISLIEYKIIQDYDFILADMKERLNKKDTFKGEKNALIKEISSLEKKLIALNKKMYEPSKFKLFNKNNNNNEKLLFDYQETYKNLFNKFNDFEDKNFNETIYQKLSTDSSILDVLKCVSFNFIYFVNMVKKKEQNITLEELSNQFNELQNIIFKYDYKILKSNALLDEKDMVQIICDKYNLENINITPDELDKDAIIKCIKDIELVIIDDCIKQSKISESDIKFIIEINKMNKQA